MTTIPLNLLFIVIEMRQCKSSGIGGEFNIVVALGSCRKDTTDNVGIHIVRQTIVCKYGISARLSR